MGSQKIFLSSLAILIVFNVLFYVSGYNDKILSAMHVISILLSLGLIAIGISVLPFAGGEVTITWFVKVVILISILYQIDFKMMGFKFPIGIGLVSNLTIMFSESIEELSFMPWIFFNIVGIVGLISGIISMSGSGE